MVVLVEGVKAPAVVAAAAAEVGRMTGVGFGKEESPTKEEDEVGLAMVCGLDSGRSRFAGIERLSKWSGSKEGSDCPEFVTCNLCRASSWMT
jgi:hypothetical protein